MYIKIDNQEEPNLAMSLNIFSDACDEEGNKLIFLWSCVASAKSSTSNTKEMVSYKNTQQNSVVTCLLHIQ
jgi:hypothetical protein